MTTNYAFMKLAFRVMGVASCDVRFSHHVPALRIAESEEGVAPRPDSVVQCFPRWIFPFCPLRSAMSY